MTYRDELIEKAARANHGAAMLCLRALGYMEITNWDQLTDRQRDDLRFTNAAALDAILEGLSDPSEEMVSEADAWSDLIVEDTHDRRTELRIALVAAINTLKEGK